jgi:hypothetical protein
MQYVINTAMVLTRTCFLNHVVLLLHRAEITAAAVPELDKTSTAVTSGTLMHYQLVLTCCFKLAMQHYAHTQH